MTVLNDTDSDCKFKLSDLNDETVEAVNDAAIGDKPQEPIDREVEIERLAALDPVAYDVARNDAAEKLGIRAVTLDKQVKRKRKELGLDKADGDTGQGRTLSLPELFPKSYRGMNLLRETGLPPHYQLPSGDTSECPMPKRTCAPNGFFSVGQSTTFPRLRGWRLLRQ
jgi:hypothetical protein